MQYKVEGGAWVAWQTAITQTEMSFLGETGVSYYFQIRARDQVNNESGWVEVGPVEISSVTKYYTHGNRFQISDFRFWIGGCSLTIVNGFTVQRDDNELRNGTD